MSPLIYRAKEESGHILERVGISVPQRVLKWWKFIQNEMGGKRKILKSSERNFQEKKDYSDASETNVLKG